MNDRGVGRSSPMDIGVRSLLPFRFVNSGNLAI